MGEIAGMVWVLIPIVAIMGGIGYAVWERWQEGEEKRMALKSAGGGEETQRRLDRIEQDVAMLRAEVGDDIRDVKEQLMRIEKLLREVG